jgi:hypothetical protein
MTVSTYPINRTTLRLTGIPPVTSYNSTQLSPTKRAKSTCRVSAHFGGSCRQFTDTMRTLAARAEPPPSGSSTVTGERNKTRTVFRRTLSSGLAATRQRRNMLAAVNIGCSIRKTSAMVLKSVEDSLPKGKGGNSARVWVVS